MPDGRLVAQAGRARVLALTPTEIRRAARDEVMAERSVPGVEGRARVLGRAAVVRGRTVVVAAGQSLGDRDETLSGVVTSFAVGGAAAVVVASVIGYLLAGAGLAPVEAMRRRARDVSLTRSGEQLPLPPGSTTRSATATARSSCARMGHPTASSSSCPTPARGSRPTSHRAPSSALRAATRTAWAAAPASGSRSCARWLRRTAARRRSCSGPEPACAFGCRAERPRLSVISAAASGGDDGSDQPITGTALDSASAMALEHTGGGRLTDSEVGDEEGYYEVEVTRLDGSSVDVQLGRKFNAIGTHANTEDARGSDPNGGTTMRRGAVVVLMALALGGCGDSRQVHQSQPLARAAADAGNVVAAADRAARLAAEVRLQGSRS
jgi:hypothetical protein